MKGTITAAKKQPGFIGKKYSSKFPGAGVFILSEHKLLRIGVYGGLL